MKSAPLIKPVGLVLLVTLSFGCTGEAIPSTTSLPPTPANVIAPEAPDPSKEEAPASTEPEEETSAPSASAEVTIEPVDLTELAKEIDSVEVETAEASKNEAVQLVPVTWEEYQARLASPPEGTRYTIVDAWATYCPPCKENFPDLVEMHHQYGDQGLNVVSLSMDDPLETQDVESALAFLREQKAVFTNFLMNEENLGGYDRLDINGIPAVFVHGPDGKEIRRFTLDDVDNQFTYEQVAQYVKELMSAPASDGE